MKFSALLAIVTIIAMASLANACDGLKSRRASSTQTVQTVKTVTTTTVRTSSITTASRRVTARYDGVMTAPARIVVGVAVRPLAAGCSLLHGCGK